MQKLIIEARINEYANRNANPHVPWSAAEIADDARRCREAGAAIVHFHARDEQGRPEHSATAYADIIRCIRADTDILIHPTLGAATYDVPPEQRMATVVSLAQDEGTRADFAPMDMGSVNLDFYDHQAHRFLSTDTIYKNTTATLQHFAGAISASGMKHYVVSWNLGFTRQALAFMEMGLLPEPLFLLFVLTDGGLLAGHPGTPAGLDAHLQMLPSDRHIEWAVCNHGGDIRLLTDKIITAGGHIAVGLGDYPCNDNGQPDNAALVAEVATRAQALGREVATPAEVRQMLVMR
ncbi:MAG: 3-keto-5-aminohexanoate cleavage enzyme [Gammaproteobacteria bacterium]|jgi:3-keto-5-aminohexanoate cleavage enzyme